MGLVSRLVAACIKVKIRLTQPYLKLKLRLSLAKRRYSVLSGTNECVCSTEQPLVGYIRREVLPGNVSRIHHTPAMPRCLISTRCCNLGVQGDRGTNMLEKVEDDDPGL